MVEFSLTIRQLEKILEKAKVDEKYEDVLNFEIKNNRITIYQRDWGHTKNALLLNKPY